MGIEPTSEAWEASILPLYDARSSANQLIVHNKETRRTERFRRFEVAATSAFLNFLRTRTISLLWHACACIRSVTYRAVA